MDIATVLEEYLANIASLPGDLAFILDEIKVKDEKLVEAQRRVQQRDTAIQKHVKTSGAMSEHPKEQAFYPRIRSDFQECLALQQDKTRLAVMGLYLVTKHVNSLDAQVARLEADGQLLPVVEELDDGASYAASASPEPVSARSRKPTGDSARRLSRPDGARDKTPSEARDKSRSHTHSRASSVAASSVPKSGSGSGGSGDSSSGGSGSGGSSATADGRAQANGSAASAAAVKDEDSQRQALEVNGARLSLKRNHQSPRQRPSGMEERHESFCYCKKGSVGNMIACDGDACEIEWFHWDCVGLTEDPKGSWYCPQCREKIKKQAK